MSYHVDNIYDSYHKELAFHLKKYLHKYHTGTTFHGRGNGRIYERRPQYPDDHHGNINHYFYVITENKYAKDLCPFSSASRKGCNEQQVTVLPEGNIILHKSGLQRE